MSKAKVHIEQDALAGYYMDGRWFPGKPWVVVVEQPGKAEQVETFRTRDEARRCARQVRSYLAPGGTESNGKGTA